MSDHADVTGRDTYLLVEALTFTVEALSGLPIELRPDNLKHDVGNRESTGAVCGRL